MRGRGLSLTKMGHKKHFLSYFCHFYATSKFVTYVTSLREISLKLELFLAELR